MLTIEIVALTSYECGLFTYGVALLRESQQHSCGMLRMLRRTAVNEEITHNLSRVLMFAYEHVTLTICFSPSVLPSHQVIRTSLEAAVASYDQKKEMVVLVRARCGYMAVVVMPLVPELAVCRQLGVEYREKDALQLNLDET